MMSGGETVALSSAGGFASFGNGGFADGSGAGNGGGYLQHPFPSIHGRSFYSASSLSLAPVSSPERSLFCAHEFAAAEGFLQLQLVENPNLAASSGANPNCRRRWR
jgi:hypothetical protein